MAFDEPGEEERPETTPPLPPEDRLWRHPSELAGGVPVPAAWLPPSPPSGHRGARTVAALAGAGLAGALVAVGVMWFTRPTRVVEQAAPTGAPKAAVETSAAFAPAAVSSEDLTADVAPSLVRVEAEIDGAWSTSTGLVLDDQGTIAVITSVVDGATTVMVTDHHGDRIPAHLTGSDPATGITVLVADGDVGSPLTAEAADARAGQPVAVISTSSADAGGTTQHRVVTASVSAVGMRTAVSTLVLHDAVQLDRAVPGDAAGGIVVDAQGDLVGVVLAGSGSEDLAVVVPAADAVDAALGLRDDGQVRRAWLGVRAVDLSPPAAKLMTVKGGALLTMVQAGSPAAAAGLRKGDVITAIDDEAIGDASDLVVALRRWKPGERVEVVWHRGSDQGRTAVTLGG